MVVRRIAQRYIVQRMVKTAKPYIVKHVTQGYGEIAGLAVGVGISIAAGDYYGAFTGASDYLGGKPPNSRNPPFGYYPGEGGVNVGTTSSQFQKTLRPSHIVYRSKRSYRKRNYCECRRRSAKSTVRRSRRRYR